MPSTSQSQQRFMGMVHAYQKGVLKDPSPEVLKAAKSIDEEDATHFAATKHEGLPEKVASWWLPFGYGTAAAGTYLLAAKANKDFITANPDATIVPSQMTQGQLSNTPMSNGVRGMTEASNGLGHMLDADSHTFLTANPAAAKTISPLLGLVGLAHGQPVGDIAKTQAGVVGPGLLAGLAIKRWLPGWKAPGLAGTVGSGVGAGLGIMGSQKIHEMTGLQAPAGLDDKINESWWRPQLRSLSNIWSGAAGALAVSRNPVGAVGGAIAGAFQEPMEAHKTLSEQNARIGQIDHMIQGGKNVALIDKVSDPRIPLNSLGDLNQLSDLERDHALTQRYVGAASGQFETRGAVKPRSTWADMNTPEYETVAPPAKPLLEQVGDEISGFKGAPTPAHAPVKTPRGVLTVPGSQDLKGVENLRAIAKQLPLAGGILAGGLGIYGLRKLFGKDEEDKKREELYASPPVGPNRWQLP